MQLPGQRVGRVQQCESLVPDRRPVRPEPCSVPPGQYVRGGGQVGWAERKSCLRGKAIPCPTPRFLIKQEPPTPPAQSRGTAPQIPEVPLLSTPTLSRLRPGIAVAAALCGPSQGRGVQTT